MIQHSHVSMENIQHQRRFFCLGVLCLSVVAYGFCQGLVRHDSRPLYSLLLGFSIWLSMGIGMLMFMMIAYALGAGWFPIVRRQIEHALAGFRYLVYAFLPFLVLIAFFPQKAALIWTWMDPHATLPEGLQVKDDVLYLHKAIYLNRPFLLIRLCLYGGLFAFLVRRLRYYSFGGDQRPSASLALEAEKTSYAGIPLLALGLTFAAFDLFLSISYHWFSTMYGVWFFATSMRAGFAGTYVICFLASRKGRFLEGIFNEKHSYQLGCLMLAFTVFWAYISFSQYFLIYNANIPEETFWYSMREVHSGGVKNSWWYVSLFGLVLSYFVLPFFALLFYKNKIKLERTVLIAIWILAFHIVDLYFNILPKQIPADNPLGYTVTPFSITVYDVFAYLGIGFLCVSAYFKSFMSTHLIPRGDAYIHESIHAHL